MKTGAETLVGGMLIAILLGTVFHRAYPRVDIVSGIVLLFAVVGLLLAMLIAMVLKQIGRRGNK